MSMAMEEASARVPLHASFMLCANSLRYEAKLCDIILFVKGKLGAMVGYPAHKLLLISSSKYFKLLFEREDLRTHCHFPHLSEEGVFTVLDLIYGREININAQLDEALTAAKFLQVDYAVDQLEMICRESSVSSPKQTHSSSDIETPVKRTGEFISLSEISTKGSSVETSTSSPQQSQLEDFSDSSLLPNSRIKEAQTTNYDRLNIKTEPQSIVDLRTSMGGFLQSERIVSDVFSNDPTYYHNEPRHSDRLPQVTDNSPPQNLENASHLEGDRTRASLNTLYPYHLSTNNPDCSERAQFNLADHSEPAMYEMNRGMKLQIQDRSQTNKRVKREDGVGPHTSGLYYINININLRYLLHTTQF